MIPPLTQNRDVPQPIRRLLPEGVHGCSLLELKEVFVEKFPGSQQRKTIFDGFFAFREKCTLFGLSGEQWIDGSFTTGKERPNDIDVITFILPRTLNWVPVELKPLVQNLFDPVIAKRDFNVHNLLVVCHEAGHEDFFRQSVQTKDWIDLFSCTQGYRDRAGQEYPGIRKGMLRLPFGSITQAPDVDAWLKQS